MLIIDDDTSLRRTLRLSLELMGHRAIEAHDLAQAFETLERRSCDVAFLDMHIARAGLGHFAAITPPGTGFASGVGDRVRYDRNVG